MDISDMSGNLDVNKSMIFNIGHILRGLKIVEHRFDEKFVFGTCIYILRNIYNEEEFNTHLNRTRYLKIINEKNRFSAFLKLRFDQQTILINEVNSANGIKVSSKIGLQMRIMMNHALKRCLHSSLMKKSKRFFALTKLKKYTTFPIMEKTVHNEQVPGVRKPRIIKDREEYIERMTGFAVPIKANGTAVEAAMCAVGLNHKVPDSFIPELTTFLKGISVEKNSHCLVSMMHGNMEGKK